MTAQLTTDLVSPAHPRAIRLTPGQATYLKVKRGADLVLSAVALLVLAPLLGLVWLLVVIAFGRPGIFVQERVTLGSRRFRLRKFRTMHHLDPDRGLVTDEQRLTPLGRVLRASSVDELPSLWNILVGDMSLVGPRPLPSRYLPLYTPEQSARHSVRAGLTGLAQVRGRNTVPWDDRLELDHRYVLLLGPVLDARIFLRTFTTVLSREGVNETEELTSTDFGGPLRTPRLRLVPLPAAPSGSVPAGPTSASAEGYGTEAWEALTPADEEVARCALSRGGDGEVELELHLVSPDPDLAGEALRLLLSRARMCGAESACIRRDAGDAHLGVFEQTLVRAGFLPVAGKDGSADAVTATCFRSDSIACTDAVSAPGDTRSPSETAGPTREEYASS